MTAKNYQSKICCTSVSQLLSSTHTHAASTAANHKISENPLFSVLPEVVSAQNTANLNYAEKHNLQHAHNATANIFHLFSPVLTVMPEHLSDIENLSEAELKKKYKSEYDSWRNRRGYSKKHGIPWHQEWHVFSVFLRYIGPKSDPSHTLDQIISGAGYGPKNVRWASKQLQGINKGNVVFLTYNGETLTIPEWAERTGQSKFTLYARHRKGWSPESVITGKPPAMSSPAKTKALPYNHPWPNWNPIYADYLETLFQRDCEGNGDRLRYLFYKVARAINEISDLVDDAWFPDDHMPTPEERQHLDTLTGCYLLMRDFWEHAQRQAERRGWERYWAIEIMQERRLGKMN